MRNLDEIRVDITACDNEIMELLSRRMKYVEEVIEVKKANGLPILQPDREKAQKKSLSERLKDNPNKDELLNIFSEILVQSKKIQAKSLFSYNIALIGFMGTGKTAVSAYLKNVLSMEEAETDAMIVEQEGMAITDIFAEKGEEYFRKLESQIVSELQNRRNLIISCGGGVVKKQENVENLKKGSKIVLLTARPETILQRVKDSTDRPLLNGHMNVEYIEQLLEQRRPMYEGAADIVIETDGKNVQEICEELIRKIVKE